MDRGIDLLGDRRWWQTEAADGWDRMTGLPLTHRGPLCKLQKDTLPLPTKPRSQGACSGNRVWEAVQPPLTSPASLPGYGTPVQLDTVLQAGPEQVKLNGGGYR